MSKPKSPMQPTGSIGLAALAFAIPGSVHIARRKFRCGIPLFGFWLLTLFVAINAKAEFLSAFKADAAWDFRLAAFVTVALLLGSSWWAARDAWLGPREKTRIEGISEVQLALRQFRKNRMAVIGLNMVILLTLVALLAPFVASHDPDAQLGIVDLGYHAPSMGYPLGTDLFSRDVFSRVVYGSRISLLIGFLAVGLSITVGTLFGAVSGYAGGMVDGLMMRTVDLLLSFPRLVLLLVIVAFFQRSIPLLILVLGLTGWMGTTRIVRSQVLSLREQEFIQACRALGVSPMRTMLRHLIPNSMAPVIVAATLGIGSTILIEASLSFLGLGVPPPTSTWGTMVAEGRDSLVTSWWVCVFPGLAIVYTVMAFNLLGDGLRDALDPRMRS